MKCKSILVVDDDFDLRQVIVDALASENYRVFEATNGQEALDILENQEDRNEIGCIILDLMMPVMDGVKFLEIIREKYSSTIGKIPVIVATAKGSPINPSVVSNTVGKIQKPMELETLYQTVRRCCGEPCSGQSNLDS